MPAPSLTGQLGNTTEASDSFRGALKTEKTDRKAEEEMIPEFFKMERLVTLLGAISQLGGFSLPTQDGKISVGGIISSKDEGEYRQLLMDMRTKFNKTPGDPTLGTRMMDALVGFYWYLFPREWYLKPIEIVGGNNLRRFVLDLKVIPGKPAVAEKRNARNEVIVPASDKVEGRDCRMEMLVEWANTILSEADRTEGYRKLVRVLRDNKLPAGLPLPEGWQNEVSAFFTRHARSIREVSPMVRGPRYWGFIIGGLILSFALVTDRWFESAIATIILFIAIAIRNWLDRRN